MLRRKRQRGFTLIELLIVVAIIGIIAAILIPNLLDALQKAKQKRTVSDIRNTGTSWMSWLTDQVSAASAGSQKLFKGTELANQDYVDVFEYLHPNDDFFYMQEVPQVDGWKHDLEFAMNTNILATFVMCIGSPGKDGVLDQGGDCLADTQVAPFIATDYDQDIVWGDGYLVRWPGGAQK